MRKLIKECIKDLPKIDKNIKIDDNDNINRGKEIVIEAFTYMTGFNIVILDKKYDINKIYHNKYNKSEIYVFAMVDNLHIKALQPLNKNLFNDIKNYEEICKKLSEKLIYMSNDTENIDEIVNVNDYKPLIKEMEIEDDTNKSVAANINKKSTIKSRKVISYLNHQYAVKYGRKSCPTITVITKFKENEFDSLKKFNNVISNEFKIKFISFNECLKKCSKERNDKYDIDDFLKQNYNNIYIDIDINKETMLNDFNIS